MSDIWNKITKLVEKGRTCAFLGLRVCPSIEFKEEHGACYICMNETPIAEIRNNQNRIVISMDSFDDWNYVCYILNLGREIVNTLPEIKKTIIETNEDCEEHVIYLFKIFKIVWYSQFGYLPYISKWKDDILKDFFQLPFVSPTEFLSLDYGTQLIHPKRIYCQKYKNPILLDCQKEPSSIRYRTLPSYCFYSSRRPISCMSQLRQPKFKIIDTRNISSEIKTSGAPFQINGKFYIPVLRYSLGMKQGCYFETDSSDKIYLGTFYYWEPESNIYLEMGSKFEYFNSKIECADYLINEIDKMIGEKEMTEDSEMTGKEIVTNIYKNLKESLKNIERELVSLLYQYYEEEMNLFSQRAVMCNTMSVETLYELDEYEEDVKDLIITDLHLIYRDKEPKYLPIDRFYKSTISSDYMKKLFYASEDELDQPIAKALLFFGFDIVIFGKMAGNFRIVSEVMDVRKREESLSSLCWSVI